ncbi:MAG: hypothetical protein JO032_17865 [Alphaproteobacteria bacterium]|nr:hypothetical protein [Alphaproteobacteria bacterium]
MRTIAAVAALILSASAAMAEAPCENPLAPPCQKACAALGAKLILATRRAGVQPVSAADGAGTMGGALHLARRSGRSVDYIEGVPFPRLREAVRASCPR